MTTDNSRADALTDQLPCPFCGGLLGTGNAADGHADDCYIMLLLRKHGNVADITAAWNRRTLVEQPAAAPIERAKSISDEMMDLVDRLGSEWKDVDPHAWQHLSVYMPQPAPAPADERAAFEAWAETKEMDLTPFEATFDSDFTSSAWDGFQFGVQFARAASATETGAEEAAEPYDEGDIERHFDDHGFYLHGFEEEDRANFFEAALALVAGRSPAMAAEAVASPATAILLAEPHTGMRVDYSGLLKQARHALKLGMQDTGSAEMLRQLQNHLTELGQRWYAGDTAVVDELLQLYCVEKDARDALAAAPQPAQADAREEAYVAKRMAETLATVYATIVGDDQVDENDGLNAIQRCERAAQVLRLEVELYRGQADAREGLTDGTGWATLEAVEWCIAHGNCGPRTRATLVAVRALLQGANHE